jgi:hypothetical protein
MAEAKREGDMAVVSADMVEAVREVDLLAILVYG